LYREKRKNLERKKMYDPKIFTKEELDRFSEEDLTNMYDYIIEQGLEKLKLNKLLQKRKDNS
jgi:uncharacterized protein YfkK (UPF0435 family)